MELKKLKPQEHGKTRALWEEIFAEDTKQFLDYYYFLKTNENEIYCIEDNDEIVSMIHLNPYTMKINKNKHLLHYIIAVATKEAHRHKGYMRSLLTCSMEAMRDRNEPFTFLVPANRAIYEPFDFVFCNGQKRCVLDREICKKYAVNDAKDTFASAAFNEMEELGIFAQNFLKRKYQLFAVRDQHYYQTLLMEQMSENGGIMVLKKQGEICGSYLYDKEEGLCIREPLVANEDLGLLFASIDQLADGEQGEVPVLGLGDHSNLEEISDSQIIPYMMVRIVNLKRMLKMMQVKSSISASFAVIDTILHKNTGGWHIEGEKGKVLKVKETENSEGYMSIRTLTEILFGMRNISEIENDEENYLSEHLRDELKKLIPLNSIYMNEIV